MHRARVWWSKSTFDKRMRLFLTLVIVLTSMMVLTVSTLSAMTSINDKTRRLLEIQVQTISSNVASTLDGYRNIAIAVMLDESIKDYLQQSHDTMRDYSSHVGNARNALGTFLVQSGSINFLAVVRSWPNDYAFRGISSNSFEDIYVRDQQSSISAGYGDIRIARNTSFRDTPTLTLYMPVYSTVRINRKIGDICMNVDESIFPESTAAAAIRHDALLLNGEGDILVDSQDGALASFAHIADIVGATGSFSKNGDIFLYNKVSGWNFYVLATIPFATLFGDSISTVILLVALILVMVTLSLLVSRYLIRHMYRSLGSLSDAMDVVSSGNLAVRLEHRNEGQDFRTIFKGFNMMVGQIDRLMERVKEEERQIEQIRFNTLQAQIHPHFLYNTLDCIRWMAVSEGNRDIERIAKAMASYYRICLSQGKDVITIAEEVEFTRSYLTIQNIRYNNIIVCIFDIPEEMQRGRIPKITLQPLVENYINHGLRDTQSEGLLRISGIAEDDAYVLEVEDNGTGMDDEAIAALNASISEFSSESGYGIRNVHKRIEILFGTRYGLRYRQNEEGGVTVSVRLPKEDFHV